MNRSTVNGFVLQYRPIVRPRGNPTQFGNQPKPEPTSVKKDTILETKRPATGNPSLTQWYDQQALMQQVTPKTRDKIYQDLRTQYSGFWMNQLEGASKGVAAAYNATAKLPLYGLKLGSWLMNGYVPFSEKLYSPQDAQKLIQASQAKDAARKQAITQPFQNWVDPKSLEKTIPQTQFVQALTQAVSRYGYNGVVSLSTFEKLFDRLSQNPESFTSIEEKRTAETLVGAFPILSGLSALPNTLDNKALTAFNQQVKDSIPFLYQQYGQNPELYVGANLFQLGIRQALPDVGVVKKTGEAISGKLNQSATFQKVARWAKENQLSDTQFLPIYSFIDALYAQATAYGTGLISDFSLSRVFSQMVALDGVFNGIGFFITKAQILLVGWEEEKPDRHRAQFEKQIRLLAQKKVDIQERLESEKKKLSERIQANPDKAKEIEAEFEKKVLNPVMAETQQLMKTLDQFQLKLDKLLGVKEMGFLEKAWKKPPKLLNDLKIMVPISLALTLPYEYYYFRNYTDFGMDFFSLKFLAFCSYMTALSAGANIVLKQIIHVTQDKAKLYLYGHKDDLLSQNNRELFAQLQATVNKLNTSNNPKIKALAQSLEAFSVQAALPILGDAQAQQKNDKAQVRQIKLDDSMARAASTQMVRKELDQLLTKMKAVSGKSPEKKALSQFNGFFKTLEKILDRASYAKLSRTRSDLDILSQSYLREMKSAGKEVFVPVHLSQFFNKMLAETNGFYTDLDKNYPTADLPFEPLPFAVKTHFSQLSNAFIQAKANAAYDPNVSTGWLGKVFRLGFKKTVPPNIMENSIGKQLAAFMQQSKSTEEKNAGHTVAKVLSRVQKSMDRNLYVLNAKTKDQADEEMAAFQEMRTRYASETAQMPMSLAKVGRMTKQAGMVVQSAWKKATYLDKYNQWFTGYPWIPAHSLLNVAGRLGLTSIVQGHLLPATVMFKVWLFGQMPIRVWTFVNEKFLVMRDDFHRQRMGVERSMDHGMETYIKRLIEQEKGQTQPLLPEPLSSVGQTPVAGITDPAELD